MHGTLDKFSWTTERVDQLKLLAAARMSASQIGLALDITRNAVIGKANRIGVLINSASPKNAPRPARPVRINRFVAKPRVLAPTTPVVLEAPEPLGKTLLQLKARDCRFPVTDDSPFLFCGHPQDAVSSYCPHHHYVVVWP